MLYKTICRPKGFDITRLTVSDIDIRDIAHALSNICRYGGHTTRFYSVAEHSIRVSQMVTESFRFEALMHDAAEAYVCDIPAPLKLHLPHYQKIEARVNQALGNVFGLPTKMSDVVRRADVYIREFETYEFMGAEKPKRYEAEAPRLLDQKVGGSYTYFMSLFDLYRRQHAKR